jgi:DNA polymerase V
VILGGLVPDAWVQAGLFASRQPGNRRKLMDAVDNLNHSIRSDTVRYATSGLARHWKMRQEMRSPRFTTRWDELYRIK